MKKIFLSLGAMTLVFQASAANLKAPVKSERVLEQALREDEVVGGTIKRATELGESCTITVISIQHDESGGDKFKARVDCSVEGNNEVGGGIVLMLRVEGRSFNWFLDSYNIRVDKAG